MTHFTCVFCGETIYCHFEEYWHAILTHIRERKDKDLVHRRNAYKLLFLLSACTKDVKFIDEVELNSPTN